MSAGGTAGGAPQDGPTAAVLILALIVLYKVQAEQSESFLSFEQYRQSGAAAGYELMLCDNTPYAQARPAGFHGVYVADQSNPGLAPAYNRALQAAHDRGIQWLLLLDQDTTLTPQFLDEARETAARLLHQPEVAALVPRLVDKGVVCSPHLPPLLSSAKPLAADWYGIAPDRIYAFNSGSVVRVSALQAIGGFPADYALDFLDHATFAALRRAGGKLFVLHSMMKHELSDVNQALPDPALVPRQNGVLDAEYRFYKTYGTVGERAIRRLRLLRSALGRAAKGKDWGQTRRILKAALRP